MAALLTFFDFSTLTGELTGCGSTNGEEPYDAQDVQTLLEASCFPSLWRRWTAASFTGCMDWMPD